MLKTSCIIDTYNHERFVCDAVESALRQTLPFDEIIVVDDASSDRSREILIERFGEHPKIRLLFRDQNGGQLACIQSGVLEASGDVCCFLDGDDQLDSRYLETLIPNYNADPTLQSAYVTCKAFDRSVRRIFANGGSQHTGLSLGITLRGNALIGAPTSCLSFQTKLLRQIFPYPLVSDWVIRADDYLNGASSLLGVRKKFVDQSLVQFRWHDRNNSWTIRERLATYRRRLSLNRLRCFYQEKLTIEGVQLDRDLHREFATWHSPSWKLLGWYLSAVMHGQSSRKISQCGSMLLHKLRSVFQRTTEEIASLHYCRPLAIEEMQDKNKTNQTSSSPD